MTKEIELLRDLNLEKEKILERKELIKKRLIEHRASMKSADIEKETIKARAIKKELDSVEKRIEEAKKRASLNEKKGDKKMENRDIKNEELQYRTAFFKKMQGKELTAEETRSITSASSSAGAAIPTKTMDMILGQMTEANTLLGDVTTFNIPELLSLPKENVTTDANWIQEDSDSTNGDDSLTNITLSAYKLMRTVKITAKVSAMSIDAFEAWIVSTMTKKMTRAIEKAIIAGTGSNQPTGIETGITFGTTNSVTVAAGGSFTYDNFVDAESLIDEDYSGNASYYMNRKTLGSVRKLKDDVKRPLFERAVEDGFKGTLNGIPVKISRHIDDNVIYVGDLKSAYVLNFASAVEFNSSKEAGFMSGATVYRAMAQLDGKPTGVAGTIVKLSIAEATE